MRKEENEREEGAVENDPDEYGNEIGGDIGSFGEIGCELAASARSVALVRSVHGKPSKAKAFNNECCCDAFKDSRMGNQVMLVDPYFSIPAIPHTIIA
nr:hypothetical protein CFP56_66719 [Quercus suber]